MPTGLFITDSSIKIVKQSGKTPRLFRVPLPGGVVVDGTIAQQDKFVAEIEKIARQYGLYNTPLVLGLSEKHIYTKTLAIPDHTTNYEERVTAELESFLPLPVSESATDWHIVEKRPDMIIVFIASAPLTLLDTYIQAFQKASLTLLRIEPIVCALSRNVTLNGKEKVLIVTLEEDSILFTIIHEKAWIELTSVIPLTQGLKAQEILSELSNMLSFYEKKTEGGKIGKVLLTGEGVTEEMKTQIGTHVHLPAEFLAIKHNAVRLPDAISFFPVFALTQQPPKATAPVNLLPKDITTTMEQQIVKNQMYGLVKLLAVVFGVLDVCLFILLGFLFWNIQMMDAQILTENERLRQQDTQGARRAITRINETVTRAHDLMAKKDTASIVIGYLLEKTPPGITITQYALDTKANAITISGISLERERLLAFGTVLENDTLFTNVKIPLKNLEKRGASPFTITMQLKEP